VVVILSWRGADDSRIRVSDAVGEFVFEALPAGLYDLVATHPGYEDEVVQDLKVEAGQDVRLDLSLSLARFSESVVIRDDAPAEAVDEPVPTQELRIAQLDLLPLASDSFRDAFPLLPGVVRDPEGRLSFNGSRPSQSILLVNGANVTDPVTGDFAVDLPLKAIEEVEVTEIPYSAEYGRVSAAVAEVKTRGGTDEWDIDTGDLWPSLNFRDGTIQGIRSFVPQIGISGPLKKGKAWFSQGLGYRFIRSRVYDVESGDDERILESYDSFTQLDWRMTANHQLTTTFSYFPGDTQNLGLDALVYADATPDFESSGWNWALSERSLFGKSLVETTVAVKKFDLALEPKYDTAALLIPDGARNNYFNEIERESTRIELSSVWTHPFSTAKGEHLVKVGASLGRSYFSGVDDSHLVRIEDENGHLLRTIDFVGDPQVDGSDAVLSAFVQDRLRLTDRLGLELGLRYDYDRLVAEHQLAPRFAAAYALDSRGRTVLRGGVGIFYDHVYLHVDSFERFQTRVETSYAADGRPSSPPVPFQNRIAEAGLDFPRSTTWSLELDQVLTDLLQLRFTYRERRGSQEMIVDRVMDEAAGEGALVLSSTGQSLTRELGVTVRVATVKENEMFAAYHKSRSTGDLNHFNTLYQNFRSPLVFENENSLFALDVPHRFLFWGIWTLPRDIQISPGIEWRSGFPYTVFDSAYRPVGERNRGGRFPTFFSLDVRVTKGLTVRGRRVRVGFQVYNLGNHYNPRDVVSNLGSPRFGQFLNGVDMGFSFRLTLGN
jgi:outer membrane receptor protein involved in Fe transport